MLKAVEACRAAGVPYLFDPGKQTPRLEARQILDGMGSAAVVIGNDYEFALMSQKTGKSEAVLQALAPELGRAESTPVVALCMSRGGGDFGGPGDQEARQPWRGGLAGLLKTAALEWPAGRFRTIDVPRRRALLPL